MKIPEETKVVVQINLLNKELGKIVGGFISQDPAMVQEGLKGLLCVVIDTAKLFEIDLDKTDK